MSLPLSREVGSVYQQAQKLAEHRGEPVSSGHVLLALFEVPNQAATFLTDRAISVSQMRLALEHERAEPAEVMSRVGDRSQRLASSGGAEAVTSLHLLAALIRETRGQAYGLLSASGANVGAIRAAVMSYATSSQPVPQRFQRNDVLPASRRGGREAAAKPVEQTLTPIGLHPFFSSGGRTGLSDAPSNAALSAKMQIEEAEAALTEPDLPPPPPSPPRARTHPGERAPLRGPRSGRGAIDALRESGGGLSLDNHPGINRGGRPRQPTRPNPAVQDERPELEHDAPSPEVQDGGAATPVADATDDARKTARSLAERLLARGGLEPVEDAPSEPAEPAREVIEVSHTRPHTQLARPDEDLAARYALSEEDFPNLVRYGRNLTEEAALANIDPVVGRDTEIAQLIDILGKRRSNNPLLVGEPGVGKTAVVEGLACRLAEMARGGIAFGERVIVELEMGRLLSGTHLRGSFSERLLGIKDEVARAGGQIIVFLDEVHTWISAGASGDGTDAAGELKTALARGKFPCIGATTHDEYRKFIESDPAFERRFQTVTVEEPDEATALRIIEGVRTHYERHHSVRYSPGALAAAVGLSVRYVHDRQLPDKAIGVLDLAGSRAARQGIQEVDREAIARVVADVAGIPADRLTGSDRERFLHMESFLSEGVVGHLESVRTISELIRRNYAGFRSKRPIGSLLFLGPTGVGKTEMVKVLADFLFHERDAIVRLDMSEFMESHSVSRFIGAPPGYVGYEQGGQLTEAVRQRPYQVVLLDEIEKAHPDVLNLLLQLFDEGRLTDGRGRQVDFSNTLVIMTSNLGAEAFDAAPQESRGARIGFGARAMSPREDTRRRDALRDEVLTAAKGHFTPELWNRIDERLVFMPLSRDEVARIATLQLGDSQRRLWEESAIRLAFDEAVVDHLIANGGYDARMGARPMRQTIQRLVEGAVAQEILSGRVVRGGTVRVVVDGDRLRCETQG
ncbi:AAA family ATPase [Bradymonadaceae bacterium TMQ3]|uniref:AAA family ATPase n=1 Tax=Lujinxingia sediminis TaxID=2480984 RepID=A0ABY0CWH7_9DELT|nr:AAA family ATPase [Lujinxingia sediminis]RDV39734.1 AAA family ATPase [Bradymonadaceae bacterium TMQ3]RVU48221.1 AAA family ATPase [Lujinxingia sediminis]TXC77522.1 AAA family ATPase [Bradymonadales bacterium TMQ1]